MIDPLNESIGILAAFLQLQHLSHKFIKYIKKRKLRVFSYYVFDNVCRCFAMASIWSFNR